MTENQTAIRVQKLRANALLGKKKHYNSADRKQGYQATIGVSVIVINTILGSALLLLLKDTIPEYMKWIGAGFALTAAVLAAIQNFFGFQKIIQGHRSVAGRYLDVSNRCSNVLATFSDGVINDSQLAKKLEELTAIMSKIDSDAHAYPTNHDDFHRARAGIKNGEEEYTDQDLSAGN